MAKRPPTDPRMMADDTVRQPRPGRKRELSGKMGPSPPGKMGPSPKRPPVIGEIVALIAQSRPDLVDALVRLEREARDEAYAKAAREFGEQYRQLEALLGQLRKQQASADTRVGEQLQEVQKRVDAQLKEIRRAEEKHVQTLTRHLELVHAAEKRRSEGVDRHLKLVGEQGEGVAELLAAHDESATALRAERDRAIVEASRLRAQCGGDTLEHGRVVKELTQRLEQMVAKEATARGERDKLSASLAESREDLAAALAARDRLESHVRQVEETVETALVPLREEADLLRQRVPQLEAELKDARDALPYLQPPGSTTAKPNPPR